MTTREQIYSALFNLVSKADQFQTIARKLKDWTQVTPNLCPALYQLQTSEETQQTRGLPAKKFYYVDLVLYATSSSNSDIPSTQLNSLIDSIEAALAPNAQGYQTLGGLVSHAWIKGKTETFEGIIDNITVAVIPIEILANI